MPYEIFTNIDDDGDSYETLFNSRGDDLARSYNDGLLEEFKAALESQDRVIIMSTLGLSGDKSLLLMEFLDLGYEIIAFDMNGEVGNLTFGFVLQKKETNG